MVNLTPFHFFSIESQKNNSKPSGCSKKSENLHFILCSLLTASFAFRFMKHIAEFQAMGDCKLLVAGAQTIYLPAF